MNGQFLTIGWTIFWNSDTIILVERNEMDRFTVRHLRGVQISEKKSGHGTRADTAQSRHSWLGLLARE